MVIRSPVGKAAFLCLPLLICKVGNSKTPLAEIDPGHQQLLAATATNIAPEFKIYVFTFKQAKPAIIVGFRGSVSIASNGIGFSEALISVQRSPMDTCPVTGEIYSSYASLRSRYPSLENVLKIIVKAPVGTHSVRLPINVSLSKGISAGNCIVVTLDGATLRVGGPFVMSSNIVIKTVEDNGASSRTATITLDDEFCFGRSTGCGLATDKPSQSNVFIRVARIKKRAKLLALYGYISDSSFGWTTENPNTEWEVKNSYFLLRDCRLREGLLGPSEYGNFIPAGVSSLLSLKDVRKGQAAVHTPIFQAFTGLELNPGDCLAHVVSSSEGASLVGGIDAESQVLALTSD